ncbi:hypothetical protein J6590_054481 [Homalodisca vitripennis]|nr:hypothetical protein J6590_054481 [Homalodisca vitripennis]
MATGKTGNNRNPGAFFLNAIDGAEDQFSRTRYGRRVCVLPGGACREATSRSDTSALGHLLNVSHLELLRAFKIRSANKSKEILTRNAWLQFILRFTVPTDRPNAKPDTDYRRYDKCQINKTDPYENRPDRLRSHYCLPGPSGCEVSVVVDEDRLQEAVNCQERLRKKAPLTGQQQDTYGCCCCVTMLCVRDIAFLDTKVSIYGSLMPYMRQNGYRTGVAVIKPIIMMVLTCGQADRRGEVRRLAVKVDKSCITSHFD